jgi:hypothetical protein
MPDDKIKVGINKGLPKDENLTIVGDWFAAESFSATIGKGYRQTMFTRHAPFVRNRIQAFDEELEYLLKQQDQNCSSRVYAINVIEKILNDLRQA